MTSEHNPSPAERLVLLRKRLNLSQRDLAQEFQVSSGAIALWEKGSRPVPGPILKLLDLYEESGEGSREKLQQLILSQPEIGGEGKVLFGALQTFLSDHLSLNYIKGQVLTKFAEQLVSLFKDSKGLTMKLMQVASYIETGLPDEARSAFGEFPDNSKPSPYSSIKEIIFEDLKMNPEDLFAEWSSTPIAVTSLGQVHRARLKSGEHVAVKIQHPDIERTLEHQFKNVRFMSRLLSLFQTSDHPIIEDIKERIQGECDYINEAYQQKRFRNVFEDDPQIVIPAVYSEYCSKRVITTEFIQGLSYKEFLKKGTPRQKSDAGVIVHRFLARSSVQTGLLHADPHPGNYIFMDGKVAFLDFGRIVEYNGERFQMEKTFLHAFLTDNLALAKSLMIKMDSIDDPENFDFPELWNFLERQQTHYMRNQNFKFSRDHLQRLASDARRFSGRKQLKMDKWFFWAFFISNSGFSVLADFESEANWRQEVMKLF
ncbi:AarF/UbiB family protein [Bdellovibrio sp. HCB337]|uniref:AarF/UbiB family protein n=1 Tax=Bdellovibrio sp. HCB337 TaxID=3394358 RepID=UPI0039A5C565